MVIEWPPKSQKDPEVDNLLDAIAPYGISGRVCSWCGSNKTQPTDFSDALSVEEFRISKMCQNCQDRVFGGDE